GVIEVPIAYFADQPDRCRHTQLGAVSASEMRNVLDQSIAQQRKTAVIVSHSFELLNGTRTKANQIVVRRFERLCMMLNEMSARAPTRGFADLDRQAITVRSSQLAPLHSGKWRTASRMMEQVLGTVIYG